MLQYSDAHIQGSPIPRNTFTELLPVTLTMEASAYSSCLAAAREANKSGTEVPRATMEMAVMASSMPSAQPKSSARSPMMIVKKPMPSKENTKQTQPPRKVGGGVIMARGTFHGSQIMCTIHAAIPACSCASRVPLTYTDSQNWSIHCTVPNRISSQLTVRSQTLKKRSLMVRGRGFSLMISTVRMFFSSPPSRSGLNITSPFSSRMMSWNLSFCSPWAFANILRSNCCSLMPSRNWSSSSTST
mmetsp:Transcript_13309/g.39688  ORF Transcript_13309/g.39688 Transcript_13309/m.39688 type:complete len:244 (-) Transcript_13309:1189-1920(-)